MTPTTTTTEPTEAQRAEEAAKAEQKAEADFEAGFKKVAKTEEHHQLEQKTEDTTTTTTGAAAASTAAAPAGDKKEEKTDAAAAAASAAPAVVVEDPWKDVPAVVKTSLEALSKLPGQISTLAGHVGGLKRQLTESIATAKAAAEEKGAAVPTDKQVQAAMADPKAWDKLKEDFPDFAAPMEVEFKAIRAELEKKAGAQVDVSAVSKQVAASLAPDLEAVGRRAREFAQVDIKHEGWEETVRTPEFASWLKAQPADVQELSKSERGRDATKLLDSYKTHQEQAAAAAKVPQDTKNKRLEAALTPKGTSVPVDTGMSEDQALEHGFQKVRKKA